MTWTGSRSLVTSSEYWDHDSSFFLKIVDKDSNR